METVSACPHHGFDTWMLVNHFYGGMSPTMKQVLETICGGDFLSKHPDEAMDFLNYVDETSKGWDEPNPREVEKMRPSAHRRGGIFALSKDMEMKARISTLARKVEVLEVSWANTSHNLILHTVMHTIPIGRITPISLGNLIPLLMCPLVPNNSWVPHLNHSHHHPPPLWNKLY